MVRGRSHDPALGTGFRLGRRSPPAAMQNHSPRRAGVFDNGETHVRAVDDGVVAAGLVAPVRHARRQERDVRAFLFPGSLERRPPVTLEHEGPVGDEPGMEGAEGELTTR